MIPMEEKTLDITILVAKLEHALIAFRHLLADSPVSETVNHTFKSLNGDLAKIADSLENDDFGQTVKNAESFAYSCETIGYLAPKIDSPAFKEAKEDLIASAKELLSIVATPPAPLKPLDPIEFKTVFTTSSDHGAPARKPGISWSEQDKHDQRFKKALAENDTRITGLEQKLNGLEASANREIEKLTSAYTEALKETELKKTEIDSILGHVSGRAVAGDYEKSATEEKNKADWLRIGSLTCMALIAFSLGYSFWETIGTEFNWQKSLFRITLTFLLSVPAAYLARESAKHREQQYQHLQTSLDLKAISPFLASLPEEEQHKIKIAIASKLFAGRDFSKTSADPFPLNTQEIIMELLKRLDFPKSQPVKET
jgi:hypothetical protein